MRTPSRGSCGTTEVPLGDGKVFRYGKLDIDLEQNGKSNQFVGDFTINQLGYESYAEDGSRQTVEVGSGQVSGFAELLRYGIIPVGGMGADPYANPMTGELDDKTKLHDVHFNKSAKFRINK